MSSRRAAGLFALVLFVAATCAAALPAARVQIEELTWPELRDRIAAGATTVLIPIGGTEQNGPHMVLGKHNLRGRLLAVRIADKLGDALVAPVMAYVPEGNINPPSQHMRWPGTITVPEPVFEATLVSAARSFRQHGFCHIVFLGEHGGYRASLDKAAATLNREWARSGACRALALPEYYRAAQSGFAATLKARGFDAAEIGTHAGLADTSLSLALDPTLVRADLAANRPKTAAGAAGDGVAGDPRRASAELGRLAVEQIVEASVAAIRAQTGP
jgi:creatinine amidohydrolase/Fe(II)-dependent formamide hydrolase-like protein